MTLIFLHSNSSLLQQSEAEGRSRCPQGTCGLRGSGLRAALDVIAREWSDCGPEGSPEEGLGEGDAHGPFPTSRGWDVCLGGATVSQEPKGVWTQPRSGAGQVTGVTRHSVPGTEGTQHAVRPVAGRAGRPRRDPMDAP